MQLLIVSPIYRLVSSKVECSWKHGDAFDNFSIELTDEKSSFCCSTASKSTAKFYFAAAAF